MSDAPNLPGPLPRHAECPECGELYAPRGLAAHRRMRHGVASVPAGELGSTLSRIADVLERLETRLEGSPPQNGKPAPMEPLPLLPSTPENRASEMRILERGLREVLGEIARVKQETERQLAGSGASGASDEERLLQKTTYQMLGSLRRRQASLLFRLQEARGDDAVDNSLCIAPPPPRSEPSDPR